MERNLTMLMDFYELTMANGYYVLGLENQIAVFDMFYRNNPDNGGYVVSAGLDSLIDYIENMCFTEADIEYLRSRNMFDEGFLNYLKNFKFRGSIHAVKEGTIVYPNTPLITVTAPLIDAQLIETALLVLINHQSLIATKASRIVHAAGDSIVMEFGARRAQGPDGAILGARAAYIGGANATATTIADEMYGINAVGTMAHSWVQFFDNEYEAFKAYATIYPDNCTLLIDTYDVMDSGIVNAIKVAKEVLEPSGHRLKGVRIDSGDLAYLSKKVRKVLDKNDLSDCKIVVSNSVDEYLIKSLLAQGACIDSYGVGERLITSKSSPVFGGVYKLVAILKDGEYIEKIKISENIEKITNPGKKRLYRAYDENGVGFADILALHDEDILDSKEIKIVSSKKSWKHLTLTPASIKELQVPIFVDGKLVYERPTIHEIREYVKEQLSNEIWEEERRFEFPHQHYVDLTEKLNDLKSRLLADYNQK